jgi:hypothetical protein
MHPARPANGQVEVFFVYHLPLYFRLVDVGTAREGVTGGQHEGPKRPWNPLNRCLPDAGASND